MQMLGRFQRAASGELGFQQGGQSEEPEPQF